MSDGSTGPTDDSPSLLTSILRASSASGSSRGLAPKLKASLDLLLLGLRPDEEYAEAGKELDRLAASVPKSSCGRGFQKGDVIWKCKTCAIGDDTCVVCQECFQDADHTGHDVSFYISRATDGGCCDCGDESAWDRKGFCSRHGRSHSSSEALAALPPPLASTAPPLFDTILSEVVRATASGASSSRDPADPRLVAAAVDWIEKRCGSFDGLAVLAAQALCGPICLPAGTPSAPPPAPAAPASGEAQAGFGASGGCGESCAPVWESEARDSGGEPFPCTRGSILELLLLRDVQMRDAGREVPKALQDLYLRLLSERSFKRAFAACYTANYGALARAHCEAALPNEDRHRGVAAEETLFSSQISVQFLNRPGLVMPLVQTGFVRTLLTTMRELHASDVLLWKPRRPAGRDWRRQLPLLADLRFVLAIEGVPKELLGDVQLLQSWLGMLAQMHGVDTQERAVHEHVAHENEMWIGAFNFFIGLQSLYTVLLKPLLASPALATAPAAALSAPLAGHGAGVEPCSLLVLAITALVEREMSQPLSQPPLVCRTAGCSHCLVPPSRAATTISFHLPLERFVGAAVQRLAAARGGEEELAKVAHAFSSEGLRHEGACGAEAEAAWLAAAEACPERAGLSAAGEAPRTAWWRRSAAEALLDGPLQLAAAAAAVEGNLWVRNGTAPRQQVHNYASTSPPLCRLMADPDRLAVQLAAAVLPPDTVLAALFSAFGYLPLLHAAAAEVAHEAGGDKVDLADAAGGASLLGHALGALPAGAESVAAWGSGGIASWGADAKQRSHMLCAALRLLLQLMAHTLPPPGEAHEAAAMRALLAHQLLLGPCTHSELAASLRSIDDEAPSPEVVQAAIDAVATKQQEASSGAARLYALREGLEADYYSPVFPHLTVESHQHALERLETLEQARLRRGVPPSSTPPPPTPCHPSFRPVRLLALHPPLLRLVRLLAVHALGRAGVGSAGEADARDALEHGLGIVAFAVGLPEEDCGREGAAALFRELRWRPGDLAAPVAAESAAESAAFDASLWGGAAGGLPRGEHLSLLDALEQLDHLAAAAAPGGAVGGAGGGADLRLSRLGLRDLRWVLSEAARRDPESKRDLDKQRWQRVQQAASPEQGAGGDGGDAEQEKLRRQRRRAQARQKALAALSKQASSFEATLAAEQSGGAGEAGASLEEGDAASPQRGAPGSSRGEMASIEEEAESCILCHGADGGPEAAMVGLAFARPSVVGHASCCPPADGTQRRDDWSLQRCGHAMHFTCWTHYAETRSASSRTGRKDELVCPLCRALCNVVLPLHKGRRASAPASAAVTATPAEASSVDGDLRLVAEQVLPRALDRLSAPAPPLRDHTLREVVPAAAGAQLEFLRRVHLAGLVEVGEREVSEWRSSGSPLPATLPLFVRAWRAIAWSASTVAVASEAAAVARGEADWDETGRRLARELSPVSGLLLCPALLQSTLIREYQLLPKLEGLPGPKWELFGADATQLVESLAGGGGRLSDEHAELFGFRDDEQVVAAGAGLMQCDLHQVLVVLTALLAPDTPEEAAALTQFVGVAVTAQALLLTCQSTGLSGTVAATAGEPSPVDRLRGEMAARSHLSVAADAPAGAALLEVVERTVSSFNRFAAALLSGLWQAPPAGHGRWRLASAREMLASASAVRRCHLWAERASNGVCLGIRPAPSLASLPSLQLHRMPKDFYTLSTLLHARPCALCGEPPTDTALCLVCGDILCATPSCRGEPEQALRHGEMPCSRHANTCGAGCGMFYLLHEGRVLLTYSSGELHEGRAIPHFYPSIYLDAHGEEDHKLRRGRPLFLSAQRQADLHHLWLTHAIPITVARALDRRHGP